MDAQSTTGVRSRWPVVTAAVAFAAVIIAASPALQALLVYDRPAILRGEIWRLFTGHWVHFSTKHLLYDVGVFVIAGWMIESRGQKNFGWLCLLSPWLIGLSLLIFAPNLITFGGLSGIGTAAVIYWALNGLIRERRWRCICAIVLCASAGKIVYEFACVGFVFMDFGDSRITSVPLNHLMGAVAAGLVHFFTSAKARASAGRDQASSAAFSPANPMT